MERGREGKGKGIGGGDHLPYFPPLASASNTTMLAYTSLVHPLMEFAAPAWDPYRVKDINELEMVQRRAARFTKSGYRRTTSVSKLVDDLGWRTISYRRKDAPLNLLGKAVCGKVAISVNKLKQPTEVTRFF